MSQGRQRSEPAVRLFCALLLALLTCGCGEKALTTVSSEQEAVEIISVLREGGVKAEKTMAGELSAQRWDITVAGADYDFANQLLRYYELPRARDKAQEASAFQSESERRERQLSESKKRIEEHLRKLLGVARVSVVISPREEEVREHPAPAKADVTLTHKTPEPPVSVEEIQKKVASSYTALAPENVTVKLQFEPPPAPPPQEPRLEGRGSTVFLAGLVAVAALSWLLFVLLRKKHRQRSQQATAESPSTPPGEADGEDGSQMLTPPARPDVG